MLPFILLGASVALSSVGIGAGIAGAMNFNEANRIIERAKRNYSKAEAKLNSHLSELRGKLREFGELFLQSTESLERFVSFMETLGTKVKTKIEQENTNLDEFLTTLKKNIQITKELSFLEDGLEAIAVGALKGAFSGAMAGSGAIAIGTLIGTASTGTAISSLSGAAYTNALLAWFGGGAVSAGGGGIALGTVVLGGIVVSPAICVLGLSVAKKSEEAYTKAKEFELKVTKAIAKIKMAIQKVKDLEYKIEERLWAISEIKITLDRKLSDLSRRPKNLQKEEILTLISIAKSLKETLTEPLQLY